MIVKDTPRNLEFLKGNPRDLAPMTREEAVLAGEAEPLTVNETLISTISGDAGPAAAFRNVSISLASTSTLNAAIQFPVFYYEIGDGIFDIASISDYDTTAKVACPYVSNMTPKITIRITGSGVYDSVSGSGYHVEEHADNYVTVAILSDNANVRIKCGPSK